MDKYLVLTSEDLFALWVAVGIAERALGLQAHYQMPVGGTDPQAATELVHIARRTLAQLSYHLDSPP